MTIENKLEFGSAEELKQFLAANSIDVSKYGVDKAKDIDDLFNEIQENETVLYKTQDNSIVRQVSVADVTIYYHDGKNTYKLIEEKQVFHDGRERVRDLKFSVAGKMKQGENPLETIVREIKEEISIDTELRIQPSQVVKDVLESPSYPGLYSEYITYKFTAMLSDSQFKPEGYKEVGKKKTTYFVWKELE